MKIGSNYLMQFSGQPSRTQKTILAKNVRPGDIIEFKRSFLSGYGTEGTIQGRVLNYYHPQEGVEVYVSGIDELARLSEEEPVDLIHRPERAEPAGDDLLQMVRAFNEMNTNKSNGRFKKLTAWISSLVRIRN